MNSSRFRGKIPDIPICQNVNKIYGRIIPFRKQYTWCVKSCANDLLLYINIMLHLLLYIRPPFHEVQNTNKIVFFLF